MEGGYRRLSESKIDLDPESSALLDNPEVGSALESRRVQSRINLISRSSVLWLLHAILISTSTTLFLLSFRTTPKEHCQCLNTPRKYAALKSIAPTSD